MKRHVLVTGASRGIGEAICAQLLVEGHRVVGLSRQPPRGRSERFESVGVDLSKLCQLPDLLHGILQRFSTLDAVVCNAGVPAFGHIEQMSPDAIVSSTHVNLVAPMLIARAMIPALKSRTRADFILVSSEAGRKAGARGSVYSAAKFGVRGFGKALREEVAKTGVRVTLLYPGMTRTPFYDNTFFEPGEGDAYALVPEDVARAVSYALGVREGAVVDEIMITPQKRHVVMRKPDGR